MTKTKTIKLWGLIIQSAYDEDKIPPHEVEVELEPQQLAEINKSRLEAIGIQFSKCKKCGKDILFLPTKTGKQMPVCLDMTSHFADCKFANDFRIKNKK